MGNSHKNKKGNPSRTTNKVQPTDLEAKKRHNIVYNVCLTFIGLLFFFEK